MSIEQIQSFIRQALTFLGGILVSYGYIDDAAVSQIVGALATLLSAAWSWFAHSGTIDKKPPSGV